MKCVTLFASVTFPLADDSNFLSSSSVALPLPLPTYPCPAAGLVVLDSPLDKGVGNEAAPGNVGIG